MRIRFALCLIKIWNRNFVEIYFISLMSYNTVKAVLILISLFSMDVQSENSTTVESVGLDPVTPDDATWILTSSFVIFTMQTGKLDYCPFLD